MDPLVILLLSLSIVIGLIVFFRTGAFVALLASALVVSFLSPLPADGSGWVGCVNRVAAEFGTMTGKVGLLIVMGALIGQAMTVSGSADRIVAFICRIFGQKRMPEALISGGFLLSIPVFYDATFYLLLPLAKSLYRHTRKNYLLYLLAIGFGATISHSLVPPTPGPLIVAMSLNVPVPTIMCFGAMVGAFMIPCALVIAHVINAYMPTPEIQDESLTDEASGVETETVNTGGEVGTGSEYVSVEHAHRLPSLFWAILPILFPVVLIASNTIVEMWTKTGRIEWSPSLSWCPKTIAVLGNPTMALMIAALIAVVVMKLVQRQTFRQMEHHLELGLHSAGLILLITAAGGAFGAMLKASGVGMRIEELFSLQQASNGPLVIALAFCITSMIKTAQGSSTTAMITVSSIFAGMNLTSQQLGFNLAYIAVAIGVGAMVTGWMNDSGFCIFSRMSGIREIDALKTWTVGLAMMGLCGLVIILVLSQLMPMI